MLSINPALKSQNTNHTNQNDHDHDGTILNQILFIFTAKSRLLGLLPENQRINNKKT
jgi:hypothetical protein